MPEFIESAAKLGLPGIVYQNTANLKASLHKKSYEINA